jgi:hypothetical protein
MPSQPGAGSVRQDEDGDDRGNGGLKQQLAESCGDGGQSAAEEHALRCPVPDATVVERRVSETLLRRTSRRLTGSGLR